MFSPRHAAVTRSFYERFRIIIAIGILFAFISCGNAVKSAQDFKPNKAPQVSSFTVTYIGNDSAFDPSNLYSGMPFIINIDAADPEGKPLSYSISSERGTFSSQKTTETGVTCRFYIGSISKGDPVQIQLSVTDPKNAVFSQIIDVGSGKTGPGIKVIPPSNTVIPSSGDITMNVSCDCKGLFRVYRDNTISSADKAVLGTTGLIDYTSAYSEETINIRGPLSKQTGGVILENNVKNHLWVVFRDSNNQTANASFDMYVEGINPLITSISPADHDTDISVFPIISLQFSKAMDEATLTKSAIILKDPSGSVINGTLLYDASTFTESLTPDSPLSYASAYTIKISSSVCDTVGNPLAADGSFSFSTAAKDALSAVKFYPAPGTYVGARSVTLSNDDAAATIIYTSDGTTIPSVTKNGDGTYTIGNGAIYSDPIAVNGNAVIKALAFRNGYTISRTSSSAYYIKAAAPLFTLSEINSVTGAEKLSISTSTSGANIYYTTDDTDPAGSGGNILGSLQTIPVTMNVKIRAVTKCSGMTNSDETVKDYTVHTSAPLFSLASGSTLNSGNAIYMSCDSGAAIYYTISDTGNEPADPADPSVTPSVYFTGIPLAGSAATKVIYKIRAYAKKSGMADSSTSDTMTYSVISGQAGSVTFSPSGGLYSADQQVSLSCGTAGAAIYYTTDGTELQINENNDRTFTAVNGNLYTGTPVPVAGNNTMMTIKACAVKYGMAASDVTGSAYTIISRASTPTLSPSSGTFTGSDQLITISADDDETIYYTINGADPKITANGDGTFTITNGTLYNKNSSISISANGTAVAGVTILTLKAIAVKNGLANSAITSGRYTLLSNVTGIALWSKPVNASPADSAFNGVITDTDGNSYASGYLTGINSYNFGNGVTVAANGSRSASINTLVAKFNSSGECIWAKTVTSAAGGSGFYKIVINSGNLYTTGYITGTGFFDFGKDIDGNSVTISSNTSRSGGVNAFIVKYDTAGNPVWAKTLETASNESIFRCVAVDASGNVFAGGHLIGQGEFGFDNNVSIAANASRYNGSNMFLVKFDSSGVCRWAKSFSSSGSVSSSTSLTTDNEGNVYAAGVIQKNSAVNFGPSSSNGSDVTLTCPCSLGNGTQSGDNGFLSVYNGDGYCQKAVSLISATNQFNFTDAAFVSSDNSIVVCGYICTGNYDFGNSTTLDVSNSTIESLVVKYSKNLVCQWEQTPSSVIGGNCPLNGITVDSSGNIYAAGYLNGTGSFNFGGNSAPITGLTTGWEAFTVKYSINGVCQWASSLSSMGGSASCLFFGINVNITSNMLCAVGTFTGNGSYDYGGKSQSFTGKGSSGNNTVIVRYAP